VLLRLVEQQSRQPAIAQMSPIAQGDFKKGRSEIHDIKINNAASSLKHDAIDMAKQQ
jgi:hypothetical protein